MTAQEHIYQSYLTELKNHYFTGDMATDVGTRLTMATDNSIYQMWPQAVCFPKNARDIQIMVQLASRPEFLTVQLSPRGGGTGTNGQSLTSGIVIDCSRYMTRIIEIDTDKKMVRVEPGVVLDQLNDALQKHQLFFAPSVSSGSRATLGGMFATDACGKGSCYYGQTSDHVLSTHVILANGDTVRIALDAVYAQETRMHDIAHQVEQWIDAHRDEIQQRFTQLPRHLTGYNLLKTKQNGQLNLNYLLSGSEGTLAIVTELTLQLTPLPSYTKLVVIQYDSFDAALRSAKSLLIYRPIAIETIDDKIYQHHTVANITDSIINPNAVNVIEFSGQDKAAIEQQVNALLEKLEAQSLRFFHTDQPKKITEIWELRKKSVGVLSNLPGTRQCIPFVEDTAVPPEHLADYIAEFRALLKSYDLNYGMFGHADAGCIHVRPALDMKNPDDAKLVPIITEKVYALIKKYHGIMWSEHSRGFRTQYTRDFFGESLYAVLQKIKTAFDPHHQLNPGKIFTDIHTSIPVRGEYDRQITPDLQQTFSRVLRCNGNGACFHYAADELICPSYHATRNRIHSPKGRAVLMREWLRLSATAQHKKKNSFAREVYTAMQGCLGCKACVSRCPVQVDIPQYKSEFLFRSHQQHRRPLQDYLVAFLEYGLPWFLRMPRFMNFFLKHALLKKIGLIDLPLFSTDTFYQQLKSRQAPVFSLKKINQSDPNKTVCLLVDAFIAAFKPNWALSVYDLLVKLGYVVYVLPLRPNGKPMHAEGFLKSFYHLAKKNNHFYAKIKAPIVGIDPAMTLCFRDEYQKTLGNQLRFTVELLAPFLLSTQAVWRNRIQHAPSIQPYYLFSHCTEKSLLADSEQQWITLFSLFGIELQSIKTGCCGMAGSFGHKLSNQAVSQALFEMSWKNKLNHRAVMTGFSCACQIRRLSGNDGLHPTRVLLETCMNLL